MTEQMLDEAPALPSEDDVALAERLEEGRSQILGELQKLIIGRALTGMSAIR